MSAKLVMKQVTKTYGDGDGAMTVLNHLDLTVNEGEFIAVLGPSGSGKKHVSLRSRCAAYAHQRRDPPRRRVAA
ncbi:hypothetical protein ACFTAO_20680 [Paenibacillus rhizoplanae]